jgi:flotillin
VRKLESSITLSSKQAEEAHAQAAAELARTEVILAQEKVQTDRERAIADRSLEMAVKRVKEAGEVAEANAATEVTVLLKRAKAEAEATHTRAAAEKARMLAESEGSRALIDAENALSTPVLHMKLEQYRLDRMPEIMSHMMKPIEKIDSIRINHVSGFGASQGGSGSKALATKSVSTCLGPSMLPAVNRRPRLTSKPVADPSISLIFIFPTQEQTAQFQEYHHELFTSPIFGWNWISRSDRTGRHDSLRDGFGTGRTHQIGLHSGQLGQPGCLRQTHGDGHHVGRRRNQCRWWFAGPQNPSGAIRLAV